MSQKKKFKFEDLQPHVEMLCDAIENKGASSSGFDHGAYEFANLYREILAKARNKSLSLEQIEITLNNLKIYMLKVAGSQHYRLNCIAEALDFFIKKEYNKQG